MKASEARKLSMGVNTLAKVKREAIDLIAYHASTGRTNCPLWNPGLESEMPELIQWLHGEGYTTSQWANPSLITVYW